MHPDELSSLPLEQKVGQLFFIGLPGPVLDEAADTLLDEISPGGVCLFARNIRSAEQTRALLDSIADRLPLPPFLSLDQEGGLVDRLRRVLEPMPAAERIVSQEQAFRLGRIVSGSIRLLGFNMDFAPVVDVVNEERRRFTNGLQSRAFGSSADEVIRLAGSFLDGLHAGGCLGCIKHFPGLGAAEVDSHEELPQINIDLAELYDIDLAPYRHFFESGIADSVMVAHAAYPMTDLQQRDQDGRLIPSSLDPRIVTGLLRDDLGYDGVAITDDLEMGAILRNFGIGEACTMAIEAGQDMLAICAGADSIRSGFRSVLGFVRSGRISEERIDRSLERIAKLRSRICPPPAFESSALSSLSNEISMLRSEL